MTASKERIECAACHKMIEIGQTIVNHHVTYYPEKIVKVHGRCHGLIHKSKIAFPELKPDPRQTLRWYKKKGETFWTWYTYTPDFIWWVWLDSVENGFWNEERAEREELEGIERYRQQVQKTKELKNRFIVKEIWNSLDLIQSLNLAFESV